MCVSVEIVSQKLCKLCYNDNGSLTPAGESTYQNPPFADISRHLSMPKNCAIRHNYKEVNLLIKKLPIFPQAYPHNL